MPQVSLYVDDATMDDLRTEAAREGVSLSKYVASRVRRHERADTPSGLPSSFFENLYGCLADDDSFVRPPQLGYELDAHRLAFD